jgi:hypothetical protein
LRFVNWSTGCGVLAGTGARLTPAKAPDLVTHAPQLQ